MNRSADTRPEQQAKLVRLGTGAGYSGDRIEPAVELANSQAIDYLVFECLAERTIALAQGRRQENPLDGFDPLLEERMRAVLPGCRRNGIRIVTNMGAANPRGAAKATIEVARKLGLHGLKVAAVLGDDVLGQLSDLDPVLDNGARVSGLGNRLVSGNAYLGSEGVVEALAAGADVVITGRIGDPALFIAPLIHEFGWKRDDWNILGRGTIIGHLLECAGQLTGGYFADPGIKDVPDLARLGFPIAEVAADGSATFTKLPGTGGRLSIACCKEQLFYEILDPAAYPQADVVADIRTVRFRELAENRIAFSGGTGHPRPARLKVSVGYQDGFIGEGELSYAGPGAVARGRLACAIIRERLRILALPIEELRTDLVGIDAVNRTEWRGAEPAEVRIRIVARTASMAAARRIGREVEALYTNGPMGGGGATSSAREVIAVASAFLDRHLVKTTIHTEIA